MRCFWCCDLGCRFRTSFLVSSSPNLSYRVVAALIAPRRLPVASLWRWASTFSSYVALCSCLAYFFRCTLHCCLCLIATLSTLCIWMPFSWTHNWLFFARNHIGSTVGIVPVPLGFRLVGALEGLGIVSIWRFTGRSILSVRPWNPNRTLINVAQVKIL